MMLEGHPALEGLEKQLLLNLVETVIYVKFEIVYILLTISYCII